MRASSKLTQVARAADRHLVASLPPRERRRWLYLRVHRRWPDFSHPSRFTEKVNWRILNDRRSQLAWTCDKLRMKEHALAAQAHVRVPATLWSGTDVRDLGAVSLPDAWVLKPTHRSGLVHFGGSHTDLASLAVETADWLTDREGGHLAEWAYGQAEPLLFVEELIGDPGSPPSDFKFFVFDGIPRLVQVDVDRHHGHRRSLFTPDWELLEVSLNSYPTAGPVAPPVMLPQMLEAAGILGQGFDFIRIDLYAIGSEVLFGEYTPYPGSGLERFTPDRFDAELGDLWNLPATNRGAAEGLRS